MNLAEGESWDPGDAACEGSGLIGECETPVDTRFPAMTKTEWLGEREAPCNFSDLAITKEEACKGGAAGCSLRLVVSSLSISVSNAQTG